MKYENIEKNFIDFLNNPIELTNYFEMETSDKLLLKAYNITFLRKILSKYCAKLIFKNELKKLLRHEIILKEENNFALPKNKNKLINAFKEKFSIFYFDEGNSPLLDYDKKENLTVKLEYLTNRVKEINYFQKNNELEIVKNKYLITIFFCSELLYYIEVGFLKVDLIDDSFYINLDSREFNYFKIYWLSEILEYNTKIIDNFRFKRVSRALTKKNPILSKSSIDSLTNYVFDKIFQIQPKFFKLDFVQSEKFILFKEIIIFSSLIECYSINGIKRINFKQIRKLNLLSDESLDFIKKYLDYELTKDYPFQFIYVKNSYIIRGDLSFKFGIKKMARCLIDIKSFIMKANGFKGKDFLGELGNSFEENYLLSYLKKNEYLKLELFGEFKPNKNSKIQGYDVDFILHDKVLDVYYFIQVKFKFDLSPIYLNERISSLYRPDIQKGINQLKHLKTNFSDESIRKKLTTHKNINDNTLINAKNDNSYFILLHNLPHLNFIEKEGIYMYEWNLFRNILDDCRIDKYNNNGIVEINKIKKFPELYKPIDIVDVYISENKDLVEKFKLYNKAFWEFTLNDYKVSSKLI